MPFLYKKPLKRKYNQEFLKCTVLQAQLERGTKVLQFDVCYKAIDQNFECGCDRHAILRLDSLTVYVRQMGHARPTMHCIPLVNIFSYAI